MYLRKIAAVAALCLAFNAAPAVAQNTTTTPTCQTGNMCPGQSSIGVAGNAIFGGKAAGAFGAFNQNGDPVTDSTLVGKVELAKTGGAESDIKLTIAGEACSIACPASRVDGTVRAFEVAGAKVTAFGTTPGNSYVIANQGAAQTAVGLAINVQLPPGSNP